MLLYTWEIWHWWRVAARNVCHLYKLSTSSRILHSYLLNGFYIIILWTYFTWLSCERLPRLHRNETEKVDNNQNCGVWFPQHWESLEELRSLCTFHYRIGKGYFLLAFWITLLWFYRGAVIYRIARNFWGVKYWVLSRNRLLANKILANHGVCESDTPILIILCSKIRMQVRDQRAPLH